MKCIVYPIIRANATNMKVYKIILKIMSVFFIFLFMFLIFKLLFVAINNQKVLF